MSSRIELMVDFENFLDGKDSATDFNDVDIIYKEGSKGLKSDLLGINVCERLLPIKDHITELIKAELFIHG